MLKKILMLIFLLVLSLNLTIFAAAENPESRYLPIEQILSGQSTDPLRPVSCINDNNYDTVWGFLKDSGHSRAEIIFPEESLIYGIKLSGYITAGTEIRVEYREEGFWRPFLAPSINNISEREMDFIDLSCDRVVTDRIRLKLKGGSLEESYLSELKVLGKYAGDVYHSIQVESIAGAENTDPAYPADFLLDNNTYTLWRTEQEKGDWKDERLDQALKDLNTGQQKTEEEYNPDQVLFKLGQVYDIDSINLYFTDRVKGNFTIEADKNGSWQQIDYIPGNVERGWYRLELNNQQIKTDRVRLAVEGNGGSLGGLSEIDFQGRGSYSGASFQYIGSQQPRELDREVDSQFELTAGDIKEYTLELAVKGSTDRELKIELNGKKLTLEAAFNMRGYTIYRKEVEKDFFWRGKNYLKVCPVDGLTLVNARLSSIRKTNNDPELGDGRLFGPAKDSSEIVINLDNQELALPPFPDFSEPPHIANSGSRKIEDWNGPTVIDGDARFDTLTVNTELKLDTGSNDINLVVKSLVMGSNGSITITGTGKVYLYLDGELNISNGSRINGSGRDKSLEIYQTGEEIYIQGGVGGNDKYKFAGSIYTKASEIFIQNGASYKGKLYADNGDITIQGGITASELIYAKKGNIIITGGADVKGKIISGGKKIEIYGGSSFDGSGEKDGLIAPDADIYIDQGAVIKGDIYAAPEKVDIGNINYRESFYRIPETGNPAKKYIEEVNIFSLEDNPVFYLYAWIDNNWVEIDKTAMGLKNMIYRAYFKTNKLRIENPAGLPVTEVELKYSTVDDREADIEILKPEDNQFFTHQELSRENIIGFVDNPAVEVKVNGQEAYHRGHFFCLEANRIGVGSNKANLITAVAEDSKGRVNYDSSTIYVNNRSLLTVNLSDQIRYSTEDTLLISGDIRRPLNQLIINGDEVDISGQRYSKSISLKSGLNLIKLEGIKEDWQGKKEFSRTIYRRVVKLTPVSLKVDSALDGCYTRKDSILISGIVEGFGEKTVRVNGQEAVVDGTVFTSQPVDLQEGSNIIKITATAGTESVEKEITVIRDTRSPVLSDILPEDGYIAKESLLSVRGQVFDAGPVRIYVNKKLSNMSGNSFSSQFTFEDGVYQIFILAVDRAGNRSEHDFSIVIDTSPPLDFEVTADPADWTNNTEPVITFAAVDLTAGISHYELVIDDGEAGEISSPYKLPPLSDGEHDLKVTAVDNAGWETTASVKVYIDTTPPAVPDGFNVVPGDERVIIDWQSNLEPDFGKYRIYRQPAYSSGEEYLEIERDMDRKYIDEDVVENGEYSYSISAVDHIYNESERTEYQSVVTAPVIEEIDPEQDLMVEYDEVDVYIPAGALDSSMSSTDVRIRIKAVAEGEVVETKYPLMGKTYQFDLIDESGQLIENVIFKKPVRIDFTYDLRKIPEDFSPFDLDVFYYDRSIGCWTEMEDTAINPAGNQIRLFTTHFSEYNYQLVENYSPDRDKYKDLGLSPYQKYFEENQEYVSPASGNLIINTTDIALSGRNGLNLSLGRIYDNYKFVWESLAGRDDDIEEEEKIYKAFGRGWKLDLPRIEKNDHGEYLYVNGGSAHELKWEDGSDSQLEYHQGIHFKGEKKWLDGDMKTIITMKNGTAYTFDSAGKILRVTDRTGNNTIRYLYDGKKIDRVIDTVGREIDFEYDDSDRITDIRNGNIRYQYRYNDDGNLYQVIDPENRMTTYKYGQEDVSYGSEYHSFYSYTVDSILIRSVEKNKGRIKNCSAPVLKEIIYPQNGKTVYDYQVLGTEQEDGDSEDKIRSITIGDSIIFSVEHFEWSSSEVDKTNVMVVKKKRYLDKNNQQEYSTVNYDYQFEDDDLAENVEWATLTAAEGQKSKLKFDEDNTNVEKQRYLEGRVVERETYQYDEDIKALEVKRTYRNDGLVLTEEYHYDNWGNMIRYYNSESGLSRYMNYLNTDSSRDDFPEEFRNPHGFQQGDIDSDIYNLLRDSFVLNENPLDNTKIVVQSHYIYSKNGNLLLKADLDNVKNKWIKTAYQYDKYGNVIKQEDPQGNVREISYGLNSSYPVKGIQKGYQGTAVKDADGNPIPGSFVITQTGYYRDSGLKQWEIDGEGNLTEYEYDKLGRLIKIIYPDDNDTFSGEIGNLSAGNYGNRADNPVKIQYYDDEVNRTTVVNAAGNIPVQDVVIRDNSITEPLVNKSRYHYDGLNRWRKLETFKIDSDGNQRINTSHFYYDRSDRRTAVEDAEGYITFTEYDRLDRKTKIIYPDGSKDINSPGDNQIYREISYDPVVNERRVVDARGNSTAEIKDWSGNVVKLVKEGNGKKQIVSIKYDTLGNRVEVIDAGGKATHYNYDSLNRMIEEILPEDSFIEPVPEEDWNKNNSFKEITVNPHKLYFYNDLGQKVREIRANSYQLYGSTGNIAVFNYQYDAAGNLVIEEDPAGNISKYYYDLNGNKVKTVDGEGNISEKMYTARGLVQAEVVVNGMLGNEDPVDGETGDNDLVRYYQYNIIGQKIAETGPEGVEHASSSQGSVKLFADQIYEHSENPYYRIDPEYTFRYEYDNLGRKTAEKRTVDGQSIVTEYRYDRVGNKIEEINPEGQRTAYLYTPQYWLKRVVRYDESGKEYVNKYEYDRSGNRVKETDPAGIWKGYQYDGLNQLERVEYPDGSSQIYEYDAVGNKIREWDRKNNLTEYEYNTKDQLSKVIDADNKTTTYSYDLEGNLMKKVLANGVTNKYIFNSLNQKVREIRPEGGVIKYSYDRAGNLAEKIDRKGQKIRYRYRRDYLPLSIRYYDKDDRLLERKEYEYDRSGNRISARYGDSIINTSYNPLGLIEEEIRTIKGRSYSTSYQYDKVGNIVGIKYPGSSQYLEYTYNKLGQPVGVGGIADGTISNPAFKYEENGTLKELKYNNGAITTIKPDLMGRIEEIKVDFATETIFNLKYEYDGNNNVSKKVNKISGKESSYNYDSLDRLTTADVEGTFYGERTGYEGVIEEDILGNLSLMEKDDYLVKLDYKVSSVGVILMEEAEIGKIELIPDPAIFKHRIDERAISIHYSPDNNTYYKLPKDKWNFALDEEGRVEIILKETVTAKAFKVHCKADDRNKQNEYVDISTFYNDINEIVNIYQRSDSAKIEYEYDAGGNRTERHTIVGNDDTTEYEYYENSNCLKKATYSISGETYKEWYYIYDANGNLVAKGNEVESDGTGGLSLVKDTVSSRYWEYEYTADNRLKAVYYLGELHVEYSYDADGKRIISDTEEKTTYFVFNYAGKVIFEENLDANSDSGESLIKQTSFIYALSKQIARVEGVVGGDGEVVYYHHDNLGSTRMMTDESGEIVFNQDYMPFGGDLVVVDKLEAVNDVDEGYKYTGQKEEASIGLYYYGARFYDPEIGRFISEDTYTGELINPQSQNIYIYVLDNPLKYVDPSGNKWEEVRDLFSGVGDWFKGVFSDQKLNDELDNLNINLEFSDTQIKYMSSEIYNLAEIIYGVKVNSIVNELPWYNQIDYYAVWEGTKQGLSALGQASVTVFLAGIPDVTATKYLAGVAGAHTLSTGSQAGATLYNAFTGQSKVERILTGNSKIGINLLGEGYKMAGGELAEFTVGNRELGEAAGVFLFNTVETGIHTTGLIRGIYNYDKALSLKSSKGAIKSFNKQTGEVVIEKINILPWNIPGTGQMIFQGGLVGNDIFGTPSIGENLIDSGVELYNIYGNKE